MQNKLRIDSPCLACEDSFPQCMCGKWIDYNEEKMKKEKEWNKEELKKDFKDFTKEKLEINVDFKLSDTLESLGLDSLDIVDFCLLCEDKYNISFNNIKLSLFETLKDIYKHIKRNIKCR